MEKRPIDTLLSDIQNVQLILGRCDAIVGSTIIYGYDGDEAIKVSMSVRHDIYFPDEVSGAGCYTIENHRITYALSPSISKSQAKIAMYPLYRLLIDVILDPLID